MDRKRKNCRKLWALAGAAALLLAAAGCGGEGAGGSGREGKEEAGALEENGGPGAEGTAAQKEGSGTEGEVPGTGGAGEGENGGTGLAYETARDGHIDFAALQEENPDIFAWLYVPGTGIDAPILQSPVSDDYYESHTQDGKEGAGGALYTEMPNMRDMCDFNTIIHGKDDGEGSLFAGLHKFEDPDFFGGNEKFYIYLPDNVLTYEIFAAYYDEGSDILRRFDYTTYAGCGAYLEQVYGSREMGKQLREGWEDLGPRHFLVTLDGSAREGSGRQYVVIGALVGDAAGKIDRVILD